MLQPVATVAFFRVCAYKERERRLGIVDVHRNIGRQKDSIPLVVIVIPLVRKTELDQIPNPRVTRAFG